MTIRDHIRRRVYVSIGTLVLVVAIGGVAWWLGYSGQFDYWWPSLMVIVAFYAVVSWMGTLAIRCPQCRVRITGDVLTALTSSHASRRYNFCPGCGTSLDAQLNTQDHAS